MSLAPQAHVTPSSVVDFDPRHEIVLLCSDASREGATELAESLLAQGFDVHVLSGSLGDLVDGLGALVHEPRPALLVTCDAATDTPVLRSRVSRAFERQHRWLPGKPAESLLELLGKICAQMDALEFATTQELPAETDDEPSNVVQLPLPPLAPEPAANTAPEPPTPTPAPAPAPAPEPARARTSRLHMVLWPLVGAGLTALGMTAVRNQDTAPEPAAVVAPQTPTARPSATPAPAPPPPIAPAKAPVAAEPPPAPTAPSPQTPTAEDPALAAALAHERVTATDDFLVFAAGERPRDWFEAMNVCRGRAHAGLRGWTTPSSRQLHTLAKARVLPDTPLWSRTRSLHTEEAAFVVDGQAGTTRRALKTETIDGAVCVRKRAQP